MIAKALVSVTVVVCLSFALVWKKQFVTMVVVVLVYYLCDENSCREYSGSTRIQLDEKEMHIAKIGNTQTAT